LCYEQFAGLLNHHPDSRHTTAKGGQRRGPSLRDISPQELNAATDYLINELMSLGMSETEAIEYLDELERKVISDDFWESTN
jgi:hypothetical protein